MKPSRDRVTLDSRPGARALSGAGSKESKPLKGNESPKQVDTGQRLKDEALIPKTPLEKQQRLSKGKKSARNSQENPESKYSLLDGFVREVQKLAEHLHAMMKPERRSKQGGATVSQKPAQPDEGQIVKGVGQSISRVAEVPKMVEQDRAAAIPLPPASIRDFKSDSKLRSPNENLETLRTESIVPWQQWNRSPRIRKQKPIHAASTSSKASSMVQASESGGSSAAWRNNLILKAAVVSVFALMCLSFMGVLEPKNDDMSLDTPGPYTQDGANGKKIDGTTAAPSNKWAKNSPRDNGATSGPQMDDQDPGKLTSNIMRDTIALMMKGFHTQYKDVYQLSHLKDTLKWKSNIFDLQLRKLNAFELRNNCAIERTDGTTQARCIIFWEVELHGRLYEALHPYNVPIVCDFVEFYIPVILPVPHDRGEVPHFAAVEDVPKSHAFCVGLRKSLNLESTKKALNDVFMKYIKEFLDDPFDRYLKQSLPQSV